MHGRCVRNTAGKNPATFAPLFTCPTSAWSSPPPFDIFMCVTLFLGNYGISLASVASKLGWEGVILMADTPFIDGNRERTIKGYPGMTVERVPEQNLLKRAEEVTQNEYI